MGAPSKPSPIFVTGAHDKILKGWFFSGTKKKRVLGHCNVFWGAAENNTPRGGGAFLFGQIFFSFPTGFFLNRAFGGGADCFFLAPRAGGPSVFRFCLPQGGGGDPQKKTPFLCWGAPLSIFGGDTHRARGESKTPA